MFSLSYTGKTWNQFRLTTIILNTRLNIIIHIINYFETFPFYFTIFTLISCVEKLFTSILNSRLNFFANDSNIISENQAGFRKGYSTVDNFKNIEKRK
jgi:hypothetical protein